MPRLVLIPGLGADAALFEPQRRAFPDLQVVPWLAPEPAEPLVSYAVRMAGQVPQGDDVVLGGVSLGGMLAYEMASLLRPAALVLIATCTTPAALPWHSRALARLALVLPRRALRPPRVAWPLVAWAFGAGSEPGRSVIEHCVRTASPAFVEWGLAAILSWQPSPRPDVRIVHVHGGRDRLIPARRVAATHILPGAGHLLNVTHAAALNQWLQDVLRDQGSRASLREADTE